MNNTHCHAVDLEICLPMVRRLAWSFAHRCPGLVPVDDLYSEGLVGLVEARDRYDSTRGASFSSYAMIRARGRMLDFIRKEIRHSHRVVFANLEGECRDTPAKQTSRAAVANALNSLIAQLPARRRMFMQAFLQNGDRRQAAKQVAYSLPAASKAWSAFMSLARPAIHAA